MTTERGEGWRTLAKKAMAISSFPERDYAMMSVDQVADILKLVAKIVWLRERDDAGMGCSFPNDELLAAISEKLKEECNGLH
jgi:hypothetical protein